MSQSPQPSASLTVQTIDGRGQAPKRRIATAQAGLTAYHQMRDIERRRDLRFNGIAGIYAGFPPTPPEQMEEMGMADFPNINTKQFQAKVDAYADNWNAINAAGDSWFEVKMKHDNPMEALKRSKLVTEYFNDAVKQWEGGEDNFVPGRHYIVKSATRDKQMGLFGIGVAHFCDHIDFRWKVRPTRKVLVPEGTNLLLDNCPFLCIEDEMSVPDLWSMRDKPGWNGEAIKAILYLNTFRNNPQTGIYETYAEWTERIRENDTWMYSDFPLVKFVHLYVKEFGSTPNKAEITHCIISDAVPQLSNISERNKQDIEGKRTQAMSWLYEREKVATRWNQILCVFSDNAGPEEKWHGVKGFGDLIFDGCHFNNLFFNRTAASAIVANMLLFKGGNEGDRQKMSQIKVTPFGALIDLEIEQISLRADTQSAVSMFQLSTSILDTNSRQVPVNQETSRGEAPTATQTNFDRADEAQFTTLQVNFYRSTGLDCIGGEMYRRIAQPASKYPESWPGGDVAKHFRECCEKAGIPEADLLKVAYVRANRNTGSGNLGLDLMKGDKLLTVATPGEGQKNAQKYIAATLVGPEAAGAYVVDEVPAPNFEDVTINQENMCIQGGQTPQAFGSQPHEKHLVGGATQGHLPMLAEIEQLANQMLDAGLENNVEAADKLFRSLSAGVEHAAQHVKFLSEYRRGGKGKALFEEQVKEFNKVINDFSQFTQTFGEALQQAQQAVNPQAGMDPKMIETQAKIERDNLLAQAKIERDNQTTMAKLEQSEVKTALKTEQSAAAHEVKLAQSVQQKELERNAQALKTQQELQATQLRNTLEIGKQATMDRLEVEKAKEMPAKTSEE
jgi:hypothetical protein